MASAKTVVRCGVRLLTLLSCLLPLGGPAGRHEGRERPPAHVRLRQAWGALPVGFEENVGQTNPNVRFVSRRNGYTIYLTSDGAVFSVTDASHGTAVLRMMLVGAQRERSMIGVGRLPGTTNYLTGADPSSALTNIHTFAQVRQRDVYPGIDLLYRDAQRQLEYDFVVAPAADPSAIKLTFAGADDVRVDGAGDLIVQTAGVEVRHRKPFLYQDVHGQRREVAGGYTLGARREVGFRVAEYDTSRPLVIDPILEYSTLIGGTLPMGPGGPGPGAEVTDIAIDPVGNAYLLGYAATLDFPTTDPPGSPRVATFVAKLTPDGTALEYSTFLVYLLMAEDIAVGPDGSAYVAGRTTNATPWTGHVIRINPHGNGVIYSTTIPAIDSAFRTASIAVDLSGNAYFAGGTTSPDLATVNSLQPSLKGPSDAVIVQLDPAGSIVYATYFGGSGAEDAYGIAVDSAGVLYVSGRTNSTDFPKANAAQSTLGGREDCWVAKIHIDTGSIEYATYFGGNDYETVCVLAVDPAGNAYLAGPAYSADFPVHKALQSTRRGPSDAFVAKFNPAGGLVYSTLLGGAAEEFVWGMSADSAGHAYLTGFTGSADFPTAAALQPALVGARDAFVAKVSPSGGRLLYSTYLGGTTSLDLYDIAATGNDSAYVAGSAASREFPVSTVLPPDITLGALVLKIRDVCPPDVTDRLNIYRSTFVPLLIPQLQLQLILVQNKTASPLDGPLVFIPEGVQEGILLTPTDFTTACPGETRHPFAVVHAGSDEVLGPQEITGTFLLFYNPAAGPIVYTPRVLAGIPTK